MTIITTALASAPMLIEQLQPFAIALAIGLLIGIERERSHPPGTQAMGLRTFVLFALLGAIAARLNEPMVAWGITLFVGGVVVVSYLRMTSINTKKELKAVGITTEVAGVLTYGLGYLANRDPLITLALGIVVLAVLFAKKPLHAFSREQLRTEELQATTTILALAFGVIPFLPNKTVDPWHLFNPQLFGILVLVISVMQFGAYAVTRIFGTKKGVPFSGLIAGFVSSAIATATFAHEVKSKRLSMNAATIAITYSTVSMLVKFLVIIAIVVPMLLEKIIWPVIAAIAVGAVISSSLMKRLRVEKIATKTKNPMTLWSAIRLATLLALMLILISLTKEHFGIPATQFIAFIGGLVDMHSVSYAVGTLLSQNQLSLTQTVIALAITISASFLSKIVMIATTGKLRFTLLASSIQIAMLFAILLVGAFFFI